MAQLILKPAPLRDVPGVDDHARDSGIREAADRHALHDPPRPVGMMKAHFLGHWLPRIRHRLGHALARPFAIVRVKKIQKRPADDVIELPPKVAHRRRREVGDASLGVEQQQRVGTVLDQRAKAFLAGSQRSLRLPALLFTRVQRKRVANRAFERLDGEVGFAQIVGGAGLHRFNSDVLRTAARQHDHRRQYPALADLAQQAEAVLGVEPVVDERNVVRLRVKRGERLAIGRGDVDLGRRPRLA